MSCRLHTKVIGAFATVHKSNQHAVLDDLRVGGGSALVIQIDGQGRFYAQCGVGKVHQVDLFGGNDLSQTVGSHAAAQYQIRLYGMANGLVGQHTGQIAGEDAGLKTRLRIYALPLLHQTVVHFVDFVIQFGRIGEVQIKGTGSAVRFKQFNRRTRGGFAVEEYVNVGTGGDNVSALAVGGDQELLHRIGGGDHGTGSQIRILLGDVCVDGPGEVCVQLLLGIGNIRCERTESVGDGSQRTLAGGSTAIHKAGVLVRRFENGAYRVVGAFCHGGESVYAVFIHTG